MGARQKNDGCPVRKTIGARQINESLLSSSAPPFRVMEKLQASLVELVLKHERNLKEKPQPAQKRCVDFTLHSPASWWS
jgi:hypothetical protein